jgi:hypothetical protein
LTWAKGVVVKVIRTGVREPRITVVTGWILARVSVHTAFDILVITTVARILAAIATIETAHFSVVAVDSVMAHSIANPGRVIARPVAFCECRTIQNAGIVCFPVAAIVIVPHNAAIKGCAERIDACRVSLE